MTTYVQYPSGIEELRSKFLRDLRLAALDAGSTVEPPTEAGSDWYLLATACSNAQLGGLFNLSEADKARSELDAEGEDLERIRVAKQVPEASGRGARGKYRAKISGPTTILDKQALVGPGGAQYETIGTYVNPSTTDEFDVRAISIGEATNAAGGTELRFVNQPVNVDVVATVSYAVPLTGGVDFEDDGRKRQRILDANAFRASGGNWAHLRETVLKADTSLQDCFVYPAPGGPGTCKIVPIRKFNRETGDFSRAPNSASLQLIRAAVFSQFNTESDRLIQAPTDLFTDCALQLTLPSSALAGGDGRGWQDAQPFPKLGFGQTKVTITAVTNADTRITIDTTSSTVPVAGVTHIAWWSTVDRRFYTGFVVAVSGSSGAWVLDLAAPLRGNNGLGPAVGDYVSPAATNIVRYGETWLDVYELLGTGEQTADSLRLPRSLRLPLASKKLPYDISAIARTKMMSTYSEITNLSFAYLPVTAPSVPGSIDLAPLILGPRRFGIYP